MIEPSESEATDGLDGSTVGPRKRVQLDVSQKMFDLMNDLAARTDATSRAEVIRRAMSVYAVLLDARESEKRVEVKDPQSGQCERLILP